MVTVPSDVPHRLLLAARNGLPYLAPEVRRQIEGMLTLENFALLAAFAVADAMFAETGFGTAINIVAGGLLITFIGTQAIYGGMQFLSFYRKASAATSADDFRAAGKEFARAVATLGIATVIAFFSRRAAKKPIGMATSVADRSQVEASWFALADSIDFRVPPNEGVIYAGVDVNAAIAKSGSALGDVTLNDIAAQYGWTEENMAKDFGKDHSAITYRLWEYLSLKYQSSLRGRVTAYIDSGKLRPDQGMLGTSGPQIGAGAEVEISDGKTTPSVILTELEELMSANKKITSILVKDVKTGRSWIYTPKARSSMSH